MSGRAHLSHGCKCQECKKPNVLQKIVISFSLYMPLAVPRGATDISLDRDFGTLAYNCIAYILPQTVVSKTRMASVFHLIFNASCSADLHFISAALANSGGDIQIVTPKTARPLSAKSVHLAMEQDYQEKIAKANQKGIAIPLNHSDQLGLVMAAQRVRCTTMQKNRRTGPATIAVATTTTTIQLPAGMKLNTKYFNRDNDPTTLLKNETISGVEVIDSFHKVIKNADGTQINDTVFLAHWICIVEGTEELIEFEETEI